MRTLAFICGWGMLLEVASAMNPRDVYKQASPAVVLILGSDDGKQGSGGTGSVISADGKVITNAHVVISEASHQQYKTLYVFLKPPKITGDNARDLGNRYKARVLSFSPAEELDLALLQIENPPPNLPTIAFTDPDRVEVGDEVVAIGHPEQGGLWTLTTGTISTVIANFNRIKGKDVFQTEASVNRGNSGGPLLDEQANMVAINTMIARQGAGGIAITAVNFSLKSSVAVKWLAGQGMGLAYAPKREEQMVVAVAPQPTKPKETPAVESPQTTLGTPSTAAAKPAETKPVETKPVVVEKPSPVSEPPPATVVVVQEPPAKPDKIREEGTALGKTKETEKVVSGKPLDLKKAPKPNILTEKRPYNIDDLRKKQMKEMEDLMQEMSGKTKAKGKKPGDGMGLW